MKWQDVEDQVRRIAELHWNAPCKAEPVDGVKLDAVIRPSPDEMIIIEITKEDNLGKLRGDINKLSGIRFSNFNRQIFTRCYFITAGDTHSLKEFGASQNVVVLTVDDFMEHFLGARQYSYQRSQREFGSSVDPETGDPDSSSYIPIHYTDGEGVKKYTPETIAAGIQSGEKYILVGEFGTGKSRCIREVFSKINVNENKIPVLAINLRENWGIPTFDLIVRNHLGGMGLSKFADNMVKLTAMGRVALLLDGFDEIGSQSWTGEAARLKEIRRKSLIGVRDLIDRCKKAGLLIAGREHYFSSSDEMLDCLGLGADVNLIRCPEEFTDAEIANYAKSNTQLSSFPEWMPRKPLICQLFAKIEPDKLVELSEGEYGEVDFFEHFLTAIAERERRIHAAIDPIVLKDVLLNLAVRTREKTGLEELSPAEINDAFFEVSGHTPLDESAVMLQRLPYLGRVGSGNPNRMFIDDYAKSGLRGIALVVALYQNDKRIPQKKWNKSLGNLGSKLVSSKITNWDSAWKYAKLCSNHGNSQVTLDFVCSELSKDSEIHNFKGIDISSSLAETLDFTGKTIKNLRISDSYVENLELEDSDLIDCSFIQSDFRNVGGVASKQALPDCFDETCEFGRFTDVSSSARISALPISDQHKTLLMIVQKLFFQQGRGRKEEALLRGSSQFWDEKTADLVLQFMKKHGIIIEAPGRSGKLYVPRLSDKPRMRKLRDGMSTSGDELWNVVIR